jgi:hypothetical protein
MKDFEISEGRFLIYLVKFFFLQSFKLLYQIIRNDGKAIFEARCAIARSCGRLNVLIIKVLGVNYWLKGVE